VRLGRGFRSSRVGQLLVLRRGERRLRIETEVDWHEEERLLKLAFPFDLHARSAEAEIQFGHVSRLLSVNTSWDAARFETVGHRFVHLAEPGYGVAVVNDSVYGHDLARHPRPDGGLATTLRLSLLRGPRFPDPRADAGVHRFVVEVWPGATIADAVRAGYACNLPLRTVIGGHTVPPLVSVAPAAHGPDGRLLAASAAAPSAGAGEELGIVVEAVKAAEDRSGDVIVRCYEALGARARGRLATSCPLAAATVVDLLERPLAELRLDAGGGVPLELRPFQIVTLRLRPSPPPERAAAAAPARSSVA